MILRLRINLRSLIRSSLLINLRQLIHLRLLQTHRFPLFRRKPTTPTNTRLDQPPHKNQSHNRNRHINIPMMPVKITRTGTRARTRRHFQLGLPISQRDRIIRQQLRPTIPMRALKTPRNRFPRDRNSQT